MIINLPGNTKGAAENFQFVIPALKHGVDVLLDNKKQVESHHKKVHPYLFNDNSSSTKRFVINLFTRYATNYEFRFFANFHEFATNKIRSLFVVVFVNKMILFVHKTDSGNFGNRCLIW